MKIRMHQVPNASLESFAITDIILNIFIFFFTAFSVIYTFNPNRESKIMIKLPQADVKTPPDQANPIIVTINPRNEVFLNNKPKTMKELEGELRPLVASNKMRPVIVRADKGVVFDRVVQVLDVTKKAGVERLGIAIEEKSAKTPSKP